MLVNATNLFDCPVMSIHVGGEIARVADLIVDPEGLQIVAFRVLGPLTGDGEHGEILEARSVREFSRVGMVVDSIDELVMPGDVVKLDKVMELGFDLFGKKVETKKGTRLGKVLDFTVAGDDFRVMQLIVQRPLLKALMDPTLVIGRSEIVEINDEKIVVKDEEDKIRARATKQDFVPNFVNPFRGSGTRPL